MKLMHITLTEPVRDEKSIITSWKEREVLFNPKNIESLGWVEEIGKFQLLLTSGRCVPVKEDLAEIQKRFQEAT